jgi:negative regulator of flagellin synthesis FlgM
MTNKITGQGFRPIDSGSSQRPVQSGRSDAGQTAAGSGASSSADQVNVTSSSLLMSRLEEALQSSPAVDAERVRAVRDAIASGSYEIDPGAVADKILHLERELNF